MSLFFSAQKVKLVEDEHNQMVGVPLKRLKEFTYSLLVLKFPENLMGMWNWKRKISKIRMEVETQKLNLADENSRNETEANAWVI